MRAFHAKASPQNQSGESGGMENIPSIPDPASQGEQTAVSFRQQSLNDEQLTQRHKGTKEFLTG
jgi:hypothetical protein